jgi:hypothetical protein
MTTEPAVDPHPAEFIPPEEREEHRFTIDVDAVNRVHERLEMGKGQLINFSIVHRHLLDGEWRLVVRADACHKEAHLHRFDQEGNETSREQIRLIKAMKDIASGYDEACDLILDTMEENLRGYLDGR